MTATRTPAVVPAARPAATSPPRRGRSAAWIGALRELADPRFRWFHQLALAVSVLLFVVTLWRLPAVDWAQRSTQAGYQLFVVAWFLLASYAVRTIGMREIIRFWLMGFFTTIMLTHLITPPLRSLWGAGNFHVAVVVPLVEESIKVLPVLAWATIMRGRHRHSILADFWVVGWVVGCGFSYHEDSLYQRLLHSGFGDGLRGKLFPTTYSDGVLFTVGHPGWTALAGLGVGIMMFYRRHWWGWLAGAVLFAVPVLEHMAVNWSGGDWMRTITSNGQLASWLVLLLAVGAIIHDAAILRWATRRDQSFPPARIAGDAEALRAGGLDQKVGLVLWRQRYRRLRNAVFADLVRDRLRGRAIGDRTEIVRQLATTAMWARQPVDRRLTG